MPVFFELSRIQYAEVPTSVIGIEEVTVKISAAIAIILNRMVGLYSILRPKRPSCTQTSSKKNSDTGLQFLNILETVASILITFTRRTPRELSSGVGVSLLSWCFSSYLKRTIVTRFILTQEHYRNLL